MKKTKKLLSIILALTLIASSVYVGGIISISAAGEESTANSNLSSDKSIPDTDSDRDGYWDITTPEELTFALSADGSGKNYELLCDIYLNDISKVNWSDGSVEADYTVNTWSPAKWNGVLLGNGFFIKGLYIEDNPTSYTAGTSGKGLIAQADGAVTFDGVGIDCMYINSDSSVAAFIPGSVNNVQLTVNRCCVLENVTLRGAEAAGMLAYGGANVKIAVTSCYVLTDKLTANSGKAGAIIGDTWTNTYKSISGCYSIGRLFGHNSNGMPVYNSYETGKSYTSSGSSVTQNMDVSLMQGAEALNNMSGLGDSFYATDSYPALKVFNKIWDGTTETVTADADGDGYIEIASPKQLAFALSAEATGKKFELMCDIYLNDISKITWSDGSVEEGYTVNTWSPAEWQGTLNGNGYTIYGMYINSAPEDGTYTSEWQGLGLTAGVPENGVVSFENLGIDKAYIHGTGCVAVFCAGAANGKGTQKLSRCYVGKDVTLIGSNAAAIMPYGGANYNAYVESFYCLSADFTAKGSNKSGALFGDIWSSSGKSIANSYTLSTLTANKTPSSDNCYVITDTSLIVGEVAAENYSLLGSDFYVTDSYPALKVFNHDKDFDAAVWGGFKDNTPDGSGTKADPYLIDTAEQFAWALRGEVSDSTVIYYRLTSDIYLNDITKFSWHSGTAEEGYTPREWTPSYFFGNIDGNGHTVHGLYVDNRPEDGTYASANTARTGAALICDNHWNRAITISGLGIDNSYIHGTNSAAAFVARQDTNNGAEISLSKCYIGSNVTVEGHSVGGFIGYGGTASVSVVDCYSLTNSLIGHGGKAGAVLGDVWTPDTKAMTGCYAVTTLYGNNRPSIYVNNYLCTSTGSAAREQMPKLDWDSTYVTTDSYPTLKVFCRVWDGSAEKPTADADGDGYIDITKPSELAWVVEQDGHNGGKFELLNDIYLNELTVDVASGTVSYEKEPVDWYTRFAPTFTGTINGNGYAVHGLYYKNTDTSYQAVNFAAGLIPFAKNASISNLGIEDSYIEQYGNYSVAALVGCIQGTTSLELNDCYVGDDVYVKGNAGVGGICGGGAPANTQDSVIVSDCYSLATLTASKNTGGIFGNIWSAGKRFNITNCYTTSDKIYGGSTIADANLSAYANNFAGTSTLGEMEGLNSNGAYYAVADDTKPPMLRVRGTAIGDVDENGTGAEANDLVCLRRTLIGSAEDLNTDFNISGEADICDLVSLTIKNEKIKAETLIQTVYVASYGSDSADGTQETPVATLAKAVALAEDGGTIVVQDTLSVTDWPISGKTLNVTGGTIDASSVSELSLGTAVSFSDITLKFADSARIYACGNRVTVDETATVDGIVNIYGGASGEDVISTSLTLLSGNYYSVYGGGIGGDVQKDTYLYLGGNVNNGITFNYDDDTAYHFYAGGCNGSVYGSTYAYAGGNVNAPLDYTEHQAEAIIHGGCYNGTVNGDTTLEIAENAEFNYIYGAGAGSSANVLGTATISFNAKAMSIYGGSRSGAVNTCDTVINMNSGWVHQIFGGSENISLTGDTLVNLNGGTVQRRVFGGCYNGFDTSGWADTAHVTGTTTLRVTSAMSFPFDEISYPDDTGITAKSRAEDVNDDEIAVMIFDSEATKTALEADGRLGVAVNIILASFEIAAYDSYSIG